MRSNDAARNEDPPNASIQRLPGIIHRSAESFPRKYRFCKDFCSNTNPDLIQNAGASLPPLPPKNRLCTFPIIMPSRRTTLTPSDHSKVRTDVPRQTASQVAVLVEECAPSSRAWGTRSDEEVCGGCVIEGKVRNTMVGWSVLGISINMTGQGCKREAHWRSHHTIGGTSTSQIRKTNGRSA